MGKGMVIKNRNDGNSYNRNEEWEQGIGMERETGNGERETGNGQRGPGTGDVGRATGDKERGTRNGGRGTGNGQIKRLLLFVNYND